MAQGGPEEWFSLQTIKEYGAGIVIGAVGLAIAIKRGWLFIGDRTKLAVALAVSEKDNEHKQARIAELERQLSEAQTLLAKDVASGGGPSPAS